MPAITITDLENAKLDVDHIAEVATSTGATSTDRLGHVKQTMSGIVADLNAVAVVTETGENRVAAEAAKTAAEAARDAALATGKVYATTAAGLAAVASGEYFNVPAADDYTAFSLYKDDAGTAVHVTDYPSLSKLESVARANLLMSLPRDPVGVWIADSTAQSGKVIKNQVATIAPSKSVLPLPRRRFGYSTLFGGSNVTVTDASQSFTDGTNDASRIVGTGTCYFQPLGTQVAPGAYTFGWWGQVNGGGADQTVYTDNIYGASVKTPHVHTATWQRFAYTFTHTGADVYIRPFQSAVGFDINIIDLELFPGSADLGGVALAGHMRLGKGGTTGPTASSGKVGLNAANMFGLAQFPTSIVLNKFTLVSISRKTAASPHDAIICSLDALSTFHARTAPNLAFTLGGSSLDLKQRVSSGGAVVAGGWKTVSQVFDGTIASVFWNGARMIYTTPLAPSAVSMKDFAFGILESVTNGASGSEFAAWALYDRALTDAELRQAETALEARVLGASNIAIATNDAFLIAEGDSNTTYSVTGGVLSHVNHYSDVRTRKYVVSNWAVTGALIKHSDFNENNSLEDRAANIDKALANRRKGQQFVLTVMCGTNHALLLNDQAIRDAFTAYCTARKAAGWKVIVGTLLPSNYVGFASVRDAFNTWLRANWPAFADGIYDFAADATIGPNAVVESDSAYYLNESGNRYHLSNTGQQIAAGIYGPVVNALT